MKILFLNYEYPPLGGGAGNATFYILREYAQMPELEVDLITSSTDSGYHREEIAPNVRVHRLPIGKNSSNLHYQSQKELIIYAIKAYLFANKLIKKAKKEGQPYDITHSFFTVPGGQLSWIFKKRYSLPYIVSLRGSDVPGYSAKFSAVYKIITPLIKKIWKDADRVVSVSSGLRDLALKAKNDQPIDVIFNGINIDEFQFDQQARDREIFRILCVSRLTERKGIRFLIESVKFLKGGQTNFLVDLIGDGEQRTELETMVRELGLSEYVKFHGLVDHAEVSKFYNRSSLFVLPSFNEGMSNTMLEALACGLPLLATDTGGTRELVKDNENGYIIKMKDACDISEKIRKLMNDESLRQRLGQESRRIAQRMSWKNVADSYRGLYREITNQ